MRGPKDNKNNSSRGGPNPSSRKPESKPESKPASKPDSKPKDFSTAILDRKKAPHRLIAEDGVGPSEDASVIQLTQKKWMN